MKRVVILGPGGAGKTTLATQLGEITGLPVIALDTLFWQPDLTALPRDQWVERQRVVAAQDRWIMDGDLGPYDVLDIRLRRADTVLFLDFATRRCVWRALLRSRERRDFWVWLLSYRWRSRPLILQSLATDAAAANRHILCNPVAVRRFLAEVKQGRGVGTAADRAR